MTDAQLIEKYLAGDIAGFNMLVKRWEKPLFNFAYRYVDDFELAKDITQQVFIRIYKGLKKMKEHNKFSSWVYTIATNLCKDEVRRIKKKKLDYIDENNENYDKFVEEASSRPDAKVNQQQLQQLIKQALQIIPEEQRVVIIMKEYQGLKFIEIAEALGESINTVKSRMYYGLNALKTVFEKRNITREVLQYEM